MLDVTIHAAGLFYTFRDVLSMRVFMTQVFWTHLGLGAPLREHPDMMSGLEGEGHMEKWT